MGIFSRKSEREAAEKEAAARAAELEALRAHVGQLEGRLASNEFNKSVIDTRLEEFSTRLGAIDNGLGTMSTQIVELATSTRGTAARLVQLEAQGIDLDEMNTRLRDLAVRLDAAEAAAPPPPPLSTPAPPPPPDVPGPAGDVSGPVPAVDEQLDEQLDELRRRVDDLQERLGSVDARVTNIAMELANQLAELGSDIDELSSRPATDPDDTERLSTDDTAEIEARLAQRIDEAIEGVADSTERLAAEQARYEIQFRADLAELAERLRRPGSA